MRLYVSGGMTGLPQHNYPAFMDAAKRLREAGYQVVNPAELDTGKPMSWVNCLKRDIRKLLICTGVATLPGWTKSKGASIETFIGKKLNYSVHSVDHFINNKKEYLDAG